MRTANRFVCASLFVVLSGLVLASPLHAQATGPSVTVVNTPDRPVPVSVVGTPTVNANVSGEVTLAGTPTVNANVSGEVVIAGTPTVNANVSGGVSIVGTPSVDIGNGAGVTPGAFTTTCTFTGGFCQSVATRVAAPGTAFRIDAIQGRTFGSSEPSLEATLSVVIQTPGLGTPFEVPCINALGFASCTATPGIYVTAINGATFLATPAPAGAAGRVNVFYTVVRLNP